jgi:hypothetical protein
VANAQNNVVFCLGTTALIHAAITLEIVILTPVSRGKSNHHLDVLGDYALKMEQTFVIIVY